MASSSTLAAEAQPIITLGLPVPPHIPHAISFSLPTWRDNVGYEEGEKRVIDAMVTGYPRFFIHLSIQKVGSICILCTCDHLVIELYISSLLGYSHRSMGQTGNNACYSLLKKPQCIVSHFCKLVPSVHGWYTFLSARMTRTIGSLISTRGIVRIMRLPLQQTFISYCSLGMRGQWQRSFGSTPGWAFQVAWLSTVCLCSQKSRQKPRYRYSHSPRRLLPIPSKSTTGIILAKGMFDYHQIPP